MIQPSLAVPGKGPSAVTGQLWATMRAELLMQWRRWGLWLAFGALIAIMSLIFISNAVNIKYEPHANGPYRTLDEFTNLYLFVAVRYSVTLMAIIAALLVADRMVRDQRLGMAELQRATSEGYPVYVLGKFIGNFVAMFFPALWDKVRPGMYTFQLAMLNITLLLVTALVELLLLMISLAVQTHREASR